MIALIDYGAGNLASVRKALGAIGAQVWTPAVAGELGRAHGIIVPGVGHFNTTRSLSDDWRAAIRTMADDGVPLLGICVGLQWLFDGSDEAADVKGLSTFKGTCFNFAEYVNGPSPRPRTQDSASAAQPLRRDLAGARSASVGGPRPLKVPHVGWNSLVMPRPSRLMAGVNDGTQVYFTHSYAAPVVDDTAAVCEYGVPFSAAVERGNISAVQFHPEKSGDAGLRVLANWLARERA